jgi:hypothetical protein
MELSTLSLYLAVPMKQKMPPRCRLAPMEFRRYSALIREAVVPEALACNRYFDLRAGHLMRVSQRAKILN